MQKEDAVVAPIVGREVKPCNRRNALSFKHYCEKLLLQVEVSNLATRQINYAQLVAPLQQLTTKDSGF